MTLFRSAARQVLSLVPAAALICLSGGVLVSWFLLGRWPQGEDPLPREATVWILAAFELFKLSLATLLVWPLLGPSPAEVRGDRVAAGVDRRFWLGLSAELFVVYCDPGRVLEWILS